MIDVDFLDDAFKKNNGIMTSCFIVFKFDQEEWEIISSPIIVFGNWLDDMEKLLIFGETRDLKFHLTGFSLECKITQNNLYLTPKGTTNINFKWRINKYDFIKELIKVSNKTSHIFYLQGLIKESIILNKKINSLRDILSKYI